MVALRHGAPWWAVALLAIVTALAWPTPPRVQAAAMMPCLELRAHAAKVEAVAAMARAQQQVDDLNRRFEEADSSRYDCHLITRAKREDTVRTLAALKRRQAELQRELERARRGTRTGSRHDPRLDRRRTIAEPDRPRR